MIPTSALPIVTRLQNILAGRNPHIKKRRLEAMLDDLNQFDIDYVSTIRTVVIDELEELA